MKKRLIYFIALAGIILHTSCQDFLDRNPFDSIPQPEAIQNLKDAEAAINGIYAVWNANGLYSGNLTLLPDIQSDMVYSVVGFTNKMGNVYSWNIIPTNDYTQDVYAHLYKVVSNCNFLFDNQEGVILKSDTEKARFDRILGEAYFSRAMAYTELVKYFAPVYDPAKAQQQTGVSIWNTFAAGKPARENLAKCYEQIFEDLKMADARISRNEDGKDTRITRAALKALYARVYLYTQQWEKAAMSASYAIDSCSYQLAAGYTAADTTPAQTAFHKMWEYDKSDEIIWKLEYTPDNLPGSLGVAFCGLSGTQLRIDFVPAVSMVNMYDVADIRRQTYFNTGKVNGVDMSYITKYPGNPDLRPSVAHVYVNMPKVFRLAEMYLIRAEANARRNLEIEANDDLEALRKVRIRNYTHIRLSGNKLMEDIRNERVKELYMEGHRLYDLKRYGQGFTRQKQSQTLSPADQLNIVATHHSFLWPIPSHELDANRNMVQNPGY